MLYIEWCKEHRKVRHTTSITACPLCLMGSVEELERIQKYMDGQLVAPAPHGLTHRIAQAIEGRDSVINELTEERDLYLGTLRSLLKELPYQDYRNLHHAKPDQLHEGTCPVEKRVNKAIFDAREIIKNT